MDFSLTDQQQMYVETVRRFVKNEITPRVMELEREHAFPLDIIRKVWEMGVMNLCIPASVRGYEVDLVSMALIIEEASVRRYGDRHVGHVQRPR